LIDLGTEIEEFRAEMRGWISNNAPSGLPDLFTWYGGNTGGHWREALLTTMEDPLYREWDRTEAHLICARWPKEVGGQGWDAVRFAVFSEECARAGVPVIRRGLGEQLCGPAIIVHGSPEQKAYFLPRIVSGEDRYCQGYSEPNHGSDLGAVETRGVVNGDELEITGQKLWTSGAQRANMIFVLCRTDPSAPKHRGLSYVLMEFSPKNLITVRPIDQMTGVAEFCEDFFDGSRAPLFNVIGGLNNGWAPAMTTLGYERGGDAMTAHLGFERDVWELIKVARTNGKASDPLVRQRLAWCYTHTQLIRYGGLRTLSQLADGREPGPEASISKLFWSEYHKVFGEIAIDVVGAQAMVRPDGEGYQTTEWQDNFFFGRAATIYNGTSQIQRNVIGERALGLPKDPQTPPSR
jgi:alkylation response protein AidB-like acyl-CoA dehydrogenase